MQQGHGAFWDALMTPQSIAVIGASSNFTKIGGRVIKNLLEQGFQGKILPVNPLAQQIGDLHCYQSIKDLPTGIDLAVIAVPRDRVISSLYEVAEQGARAVIIFTSGFSEMGDEGVQLQSQISRIARTSGMRICGPNCAGIINFNARAAASFTIALSPEKPVKPGSVALVGQSGALLFYLVCIGRDEGIGFSHCITTGNEADLDFADYINYLSSDPAVRVISGYLEGFRDIAKLRKALETARDAGKIVVIMKSGRFDEGAKAVQSHTGSMAGSDRIFEAVFNQTGAIRATSIVEFIDYIQMFSLMPPARGNRVGILTQSGATGAIMSDTCGETGLSVPQLSLQTQESLLKVLKFNTAQNPIDIATQLLSDAGSPVLQSSLEYIGNDPNIDAIAVSLGMYDHLAEKMVRDITQAAQKIEKPVAVSWVAGPKWAVHSLREAGVPAYTDPTRCIKALGAWFKRITLKVSNEKEDNISKDEAWLSRISRPNELIAKEFIAAHGIPVPLHFITKFPAEALKIANQLGYPVVLKVVSERISHKTEIGGVKLNIGSDDQLIKAYNEILENIRRSQLMADLDGILVEKMIPPGVEVILGMATDPVGGPFLSFGLGGIYTELYKDIAIGVPPLSKEDAQAMIKRTKAYQLLAGFRGGPEYDLEALTKTIMHFSGLIIAYGENINELEINPLVVLPGNQGVIAADALLVPRL